MLYKFTLLHRVPRTWGTPPAHTAWEGGVINTFRTALSQYLAGVGFQMLLFLSPQSAYLGEVFRAVSSGSLVGTTDRTPLRLDSSQPYWVTSLPTAHLIWPLG